tara:strand:+ start:1639 stop:1920 length:282 start_codon:yes stop_codon:yes gene_type:complete
MIRLLDNIFLGFFFGLLIPALTYSILSFILQLFLDEIPIRKSTLHVISLFINFPIFKEILIKYKKDSFGRGMLFSTLVLALYFIIHHKMLFFK